MSDFAQHLAYELGIGQEFDNWDSTERRGAPARVKRKTCFRDFKIFFPLQARQLMQMWQSAFGMDATPEAMVETLQRIPIAKDIVDRINKHCE